MAETFIPDLIHALAVSPSHFEGGEQSALEWVDIDDPRVTREEAEMAAKIRSGRFENWIHRIPLRKENPDAKP